MSSSLVSPPPKRRRLRWLAPSTGSSAAPSADAVPAPTGSPSLRALLTTRDDGGYQSPAFQSASRSVTQLRVRTADQLTGLAVLGRVLYDVRWLTFDLSASPSGGLIDSLLRDGSIPALGRLRWRLAQGVVLVPPTMESYLQGGDRRPLRKKLHRAEAMGIRSLPVPAADRRAIGDLVLGPHPTPHRRMIREACQTWVVAVDAQQQPLALALLVRDGEVAQLYAFKSREGLDGQSEARYALHTEVVQMLVREGVRILVTHAGSSLTLSPGLQQFHRQTGYVVRHLRWRLT